ncbi:hypothetical protein DFH29DRAFT_1081325 [Suillus ampliporus]|nr:hypothetical protein DFH29DRAFT_1081325 [Suillus ampliporus]
MNSSCSRSHFLLRDLLEALDASVSAHQPADSHHNFVPMPPSGESNVNIMFRDDLLVTPPVEDRNRTVADGSVWLTRVLHAPQPRYPDSAYVGSYSPVENQIIGLSISRPSAPSPILAMQGSLLGNSRDIFDNPPPPLHLPPHNRGPRFHPYDIDRRHEHHSTYLCQWDDEGRLCNHELQATPKDVLAHLREYHRIGIDNNESYHCLWVTPHGLCEKQLKIQSFGRHVITHIGIRIQCSVCGMTVSRNDCAVKHRRQHPNCSQATFMIIPGGNA